MSYPYQPPQPYSYPPAPPRAPVSGRAIAGLTIAVLGIALAWFTFGLPSALAATLGHDALKEIRAGRRTGFPAAVVTLAIAYPTLLLGTLMSALVYWGLPG